VPEVEEVEAVALERVRRVPWPGGGGYCVGYCEVCIVAGGAYIVVVVVVVWGVAEVDVVLVGNTPEDVVRVRE
jgi:hypothetical protein